MTGGRSKGPEVMGASARRAVKRYGSRPPACVPPAEPRKRVEKTYGSRLPVSGQEPPKLTAYERRKAERRAQQGR